MKSLMRILVFEVGLSLVIQMSPLELSSLISNFLANCSKEVCDSFADDEPALFAVSVCLLPQQVDSLPWITMYNLLHAASNLYSAVYAPMQRQISAIHLLYGLGTILEIWSDDTTQNCSMITIPEISSADRMSIFSFLEHSIRSALYSVADSVALKSLEDLDECCHALGALNFLPTTDATETAGIELSTLQFAHSILCLNYTPISFRIVSIVVSYLIKNNSLQLFSGTADRSVIDDLLLTLFECSLDLDEITLNDTNNSKTHNTMAMQALNLAYPSLGQCSGMLLQCKWKTIRYLVDISVHSSSYEHAFRDRSVIRRIIEKFDVYPWNSFSDVVYCLRSLIKMHITSMTPDDVDEVLSISWQAIMSASHVSSLTIKAFILLAFDLSIMSHSLVHVKFYDLLIQYAQTERPHIMQALVFHLIGQWTANQDLFVPYLSRVRRLLLYKEPKICDNARSDLISDDGTMTRVLVLRYLENLVEPNESLLNELSLLIEDLVSMNLEDQYAKQSMVGTELFGHKLRSWQSLCVLSKYATEEVMETVKDKLFQCLEQSCAHGIRVYMEIFVAALTIKFKSLILPILISKLSMYNHPQQTLSSYFVIIGHLILEEQTNLLDRFDESELNLVLSTLIPWLACSNGLPRAIAQILVQRLVPMVLTHVSENGNDQFGNTLNSILNYLENNIEASKLMKRQQNFFRESSLEKRSKVDDLLRYKVDGDDDIVPPHLLDVIADFYKNYNVSESNQLEIIAEEVSTELEISSLQMKRTTFEQLQLMFEDRKDTLSRNVNGYKKQPPIVVASLIDKITNLAGIARTCEVFAVEQLWIADKRILKSDVFQGIAVSSESWLDIIEVKSVDLVDVLRAYKMKGYSIIGLEQTDSSQSLLNSVWPEKSILLLGHEKEGINVELLHEVDVCLEIPQLGVIRSLNVHVSCALAIWEASKQNVFR